MAKDDKARKKMAKASKRIGEINEKIKKLEIKKDQMQKILDLEELDKIKNEINSERVTTIEKFFQGRIIFQERQIQSEPLFFLFENLSTNSI